MAPPVPVWMTAAVRTRCSKLEDAAFEEGLLVARGLVVSVLAQVAELARLLDPLDDLGTLDGLQSLQLRPHRAEPVGGQVRGCVARWSCRRVAGLGLGRRSARTLRRRGRAHALAAGAIGALDAGGGADRRRLDAQQRARQPGLAPRPGGRLEVGPRQQRCARGQSLTDIVRHRGGEGLEDLVLVLLGGVGLGPPQSKLRRLPQGLQPVAAGVGLGMAQLGGIQRGHAAAQALVGAAEVEHRLVRQPEAGETSRQRRLRGAFTIQAQLGNTLQPSAYLVDVDGGRMGWGGDLDGEDAGGTTGRLAAPARGAVDIETDRAQQVGGGGCRGHGYRVTQSDAEPRRRSFVHT